MYKLYFFVAGILLLSICPLQGQTTELPLVFVRTMEFEKISGTIHNATEFELILTKKEIESPLHLKAQNIRKIHVPKYPKPGPWGAIIGAGVGMLLGALILATPPNPNAGLLEEFPLRFGAFIGVFVGGIAGSIIGHQIRKNAGPKFKINGNIDTFRQQRNAINKFGYTN